MLFQRFYRILRTGWGIHTVNPALERRQVSLIRPNQKNHHLFHTGHFDSKKISCLFPTWKKALSISINPCSFANGLATITMSNPCFNSSSCKRQHSRITLVTRCRTTLFPTFLLTEIPIRVSVRSFGILYIIKDRFANDCLLL